jgi:hypothetical protein
LDVGGLLDDPLAGLDAPGLAGGDGADRLRVLVGLAGLTTTAPLRTV